MPIKVDTLSSGTYIIEICLERDSVGLCDYIDYYKLSTLIDDCMETLFNK